MADDSPDSWWSRNWKRALSLGCLTLLLLGVGLVAGIMAFIRSIGPVEEAIALASANCAVDEALGAPLDAGWLVSGSVDVSGPSGDAALSFPLRGSRGSGKLHLVADKQAGRWHFAQLQLVMQDGGQSIDVLVPRNERCEPQRAPKEPHRESPAPAKAGTTGRPSVR